MKKNILNIRILMFLCFLLIALKSLSQSKRERIKEYKSKKEYVSNCILLKKENPLDMFKTMDFLPRIVWGKVDRKLLTKREVMIAAKPTIIAFYDYDNDGHPDLFVLETKEGNSLPNPNDVLYIKDTDKNGKPDLVEYLDIQTQKKYPLKAIDGIWNFDNMFGHKTVNSNDENYYNLLNHYLKGLN